MELWWPVDDVSDLAGTFTIGKTFNFEAGHRLPSLPPDHKCSRQHGHGYQVEVILTASALADPGFVTDFGDLAPFKEFLNSELDHRNLHEVLPVEPTSENLAQFLAGWFLQHVEPLIPGHLIAVQVRETAHSWARFDVEIHKPGSHG
ncbi:6-pyruvoyl trahydropterin synthase family protein [Microlunatus speluncae]|uniref:6-pyruvoyl trahydropterin synthase family protein n=1 Tax=Microlunatus speluncae TaxID=2594267 RepID=UPI001C2D5DEA|nr:6-carboxytetrahydropterin synthase [Microlunatus speluncae]